MYPSYLPAARRVTTGFALAIAACLALPASGLGLTGTAQASEGSGSCSRSDGSNGADECLYYHANWDGACFADPIKDAYTNWVFADCSTPNGYNTNPDPTSGAGQPVRNAAVSAQNWSYLNTCHIWQYPNWTGNEQDDLPNEAINLQANLRNNQASQSWG